METHISIKKGLLFELIIIVLLLILIEGTAHVVEFISPPPGTAGKFKILPRQEGKYRIFVYGGSTVYGLPVRQFSFTSQLEFWLRDLHPDKPLEVYNFGMSAQPSAYVRRMIEETITYDPDLLIVLTGHNEFLNRRTSSLIDKTVACFALTRVMSRVWNRVRPILFPLPGSVVMPDQIKGHNRSSNLFKERVQTYLHNLQAIVEIAQKNNKPLILMTAPSNVADWPPVYKRIAENGCEKDCDSWVAEVDRLISDGLTGKAKERISRLLKTYHNDPLLLYLSAKANTAAGNYERAKILFTRAKDLDPVPWRVLTTFNQAIRKLAEDDRVFLVDAEKNFQQQARHGLVGFSLIADNCHPTPLGNAVIAGEILKVMRQNNLFVEQDLVSSSIDSQLEYFLLKTFTPSKRQSLKMSYLLSNAKYSMKTPFYNYTASKMYLDRALAMDSSNWKIWVNLATLSFFKNHVEEGRQQLRKAVKLRGKPIDPDDRKNAPYLRESLELSGTLLEDL